MKNTKKALLLSVMSLVLCLSMLVGTTFAWFTDSVSTANNTIASGNLDVVLSYKLDENAAWAEVNENTKLFDDAALWEPGYTQVVYLKVANAGSLALKYQLGLNILSELSGTNVDEETFKLSDYIQFGVIETEDENFYTDRAAARAAVATASKKISAGYSKSSALYAKGTQNELSEEYVALVVYMPETVGNEANHLTGTAAPSITLGLNLVATQLMAEEDSFDETYDKDAWVDGFQVFSAADLQAAINNGETEIMLMADIAAEAAIVIPEGADVKLDLNGYDITIETAYNDAAPSANSALVNNGKLTLIGEGTIKALNNYTVRNYGEMVIDGITVENGIMNYADLTVESGNISNSRSGKHTIYGYAATLTINGGEIYNGNPGNAAIYASGGEVAITGGQFSIADGTATLGWTSCLLDAQGNAKYAISGGEINGEIRDYNKNTQVTGGIFGHASVKNFLAAGYKTVENNGKYVVVPSNVDKVIATAADLAALSAKAFTGNNGTAESYVIALVADIDMGGAEISAMIAQRGDSLEFLGNGHTISNAKIVSGENDNSTGSAAMFYAYPNSTLKVSNLTLKDITVTSDENGSGYAAAVIGYCEGAAILENVDVVNAKVTGAKSSGLLAGHVGNGGTLAATDCDVNGTVTISDYEAAGHYAGKVIGTVAGDITLNGVTYDATVGGNLHAKNAGGIYGRQASGKLTVDGTEVKAVSSQDALNTAINTNNVTIELAAGEYTMPSNGAAGTITISGTEDTVIDMTKGAYLENAQVSFEGVTIKTGTGMVNGNGADYAALYTPNATYTNCTFVGPMRVGRDGAKFVGCTFTALGNDYIWNYGNDVTFEGCTFNTEGKAILLYNDGGSEIANVVVKNCVFNATKGAKAGAIANQNCAAIEIHNYGNGAKLTTEGNTYDSNFSGEWRIKTYEAGRTQIFVNGTEYTTIAIDGKTMTIDADKNVTIN